MWLIKVSTILIKTDFQINIISIIKIVIDLDQSASCARFI